MFVAYVVVTIVTAAANIYAATADFTRPAWLLHNMSKLGVPESRLPTLGMLKAAGAVGLLIGLAVPSIGAAAAIGSSYSLWPPSLLTCVPGIIRLASP
jgi:hypothetical protein